MSEEEEDYVLIRGDFNARTGNEGGLIVYEEEKGEGKRRSKDKTINREGKVLLNKLQEKGWMILNDSGEKEGGWTYIGERETSVIDYAVVNEKAREEIETVIKGERTESDHVPIEVTLKEVEEEDKEKKIKIEVERSVWIEEGIEQYKRCEG